MKKKQNYSTENFSKEEKNLIDKIEESKIPIKKNLVNGIKIIGEIKIQKYPSDYLEDKEFARGIYMTLIMGTEDIYKSTYGYVPEEFKKLKNFSIKIKLDIRIALTFMLGWILEAAIGKEGARKLMNYMHDFWFKDLEKEQLVIKVSEFLLNPEEKRMFLGSVSSITNSEIQDCNTTVQTIAKSIVNKRMLKYALLWNDYFDKGLGPIINISIQLCRDIFDQDPTTGTNDLLLFDSIQAVELSECFYKTTKVIERLMR